MMTKTELRTLARTARRELQLYQNALLPHVEETLRERGTAPAAYRAEHLRRAQAALSELHGTEGRA
jgi:hypothetical protein